MASVKVDTDKSSSRPYMGIIDQQGGGEAGEISPGSKDKKKPGFLKQIKSAFKLFVPKVYDSSGPYHVGVFDHYFKPRPGFDFKSAFYFTESEIEQEFFPTELMFRVYYPTEKDIEKGEKIDWLPEPIDCYSHGYASFSKTPNFFSNTIFNVLRPHIRQPAYHFPKLLNPELLSYSSPSVSGVESIHENTKPSDNIKESVQIDSDSSKEKVNTISTEQSNRSDRPNEKLFPVAVFSHGLAGNRTTYSAVCRELASYGFIVIAIEHKDGSASATFLRDQDKSLLFQDFEKFRVKKNKQLEKTPDFVPMLDFGPERLAFQKRKLKMRLDEIDEVVNLLYNLNSAEPTTRNSLDESKDTKDAQSTNGDNPFASIGLEGKMDINNMIIAGHSFGGALALETIKRNNTGFSNGSKPFKAAVLLDPWMFSVDKEVPELGIPTLVLRSEDFSQYTENYEQELEYFRISLDKGEAGSLLSTHSLFYSATIKKIKHQHFSDMYSILPWVAKLNKPKFDLDPHQALSITNNLIIEFLRISYSKDLHEHPDNLNTLAEFDKKNMDYISFD
ncbi:hypothetical protein BB560_001221 [Smittium megazygosporum]|uniref:1-alkyl-2-acetylglycerophosphocholine esterase n=1 Tax=Smittium megazygosporum TaxID=133381 RepID=A0A2T9ZI56_9FUNG|nr:hypothetical protein BB560_001221 [Smittium megazygosporum]